ncbi:hypothetical protein NQ317_001474 [Molorchus minor]|uniref:Uncharacterized protein n=1 Tax=Molorchus minor TaxID=1323400 RepID=A0ABQ9JV66_9CUCU|nr:hypothetical protein NQ317_001474 [Molorchus minor]
MNAATVLCFSESPVYLTLLKLKLLLNGRYMTCTTWYWVVIPMAAGGFLNVHISVVKLGPKLYFQVVTISGSCYEGQWQNGKRHGLGVESRGRWIYRGEWTQGFKGRYGVRQSNTSTAKYEGTWANGLQDGYGSETYADDGTYQGQWMRGMRHGYGIRKSAPFGKASKYRANKALRASLTSLRSNEAQGHPEPSDKRDRRVDDSRGGFVLYKNSTEPTVRRKSLGTGNVKKGLFNGLKIKKQKSTGDLDKRGGGSGSIRSTGSSASWVSTDSGQSGMTNASGPSDSNASFVVEDETMDPAVTETYMGEWKNDKRSGYGISERSDGLKYEGEWYANKKYGYGVTTFNNGEKEEGKYKNNVLITSQKKKLFLMRSAKFRERIDAARCKKSDIAINRTATARGKAEQADIAAAHAREDSDIAEGVAKQYAPDFRQPGLERLKERQNRFREMQKHNNPNPVDMNLDKKDPPNPASNYNHNQTSNPYSNPPNPGQNFVEKTIPNHTPNIPNNIGSKPINPNIPNQNPYSQMRNNPAYGQEPRLPENNTTHVGWNQPQSHLYNNPNNPSATQPPINEVGPKLSQNANENNPANDFTQRPRNSITGTPPRRMSRPTLGSIGPQSSKEYLEQYRRPPSRDTSVDRYTKATGRLNTALTSRQPSVDRTTATLRPSETPDRTIRAPSAVRGTTPVPVSNNVGTRNGSVMTGNAIRTIPDVYCPDKISNSGYYSSSRERFNAIRKSAAGFTYKRNMRRLIQRSWEILGYVKSTLDLPKAILVFRTQPFEEIILRKRGLGQDIIPSPNQPKRTESLFIPGQPTPQAAAKVSTHQVSIKNEECVIFAGICKSLG